MKKENVERLRRDAPENFFRDGEFSTEAEAYEYWARQPDPADPE